MPIPHKTADYPNLRKVVDLPALTPAGQGIEDRRRRRGRRPVSAQPV